MSQMPYRAQGVAVAVAAALTLGATAQAAQMWPVYEIVNLDEVFSVKGTLTNTQQGYGMAVSNGVVIGLSKGVNDASTEDEDTDLDDDINAILPESGVTANSIRRQFVGNNFLFQHDEANGYEPVYVPLLEDKVPVVNPDPEDDDTPRINAFYFGAGAEAYGLRFGSTSAPQEAPVENPNFNPSPEEFEDEDGVDDDNQPYDDDQFFYYRDFENRAFVQRSDALDEFTLLAPPFTQFTAISPFDDGTEFDGIIDVGGISVASAMNNLGSVVGYASIGLSSSSETTLQSCVDAFYLGAPSEEEDEDEDDNTFVPEPNPIEICVQSAQNSALTYQSRAYRWEMDFGDLTVDEARSRALPLPFNVEEGSTDVYTTQALGVNDQGWVVGRSPAAKDPDAAPDDVEFINSNLWAMAWDFNDQPRLIGPTLEDSDRVFQSIAYDVNDSGIAVGVVQRFISGYTRLKFGWVDLNAEGDLEFTEPNDFFEQQSDFSSRARSINNNGMIVGNIEVDTVQNLPRRVRAFLYNQPEDEFVNLNELLTCRSRGLVEGTELAEDGEPVYVNYRVTDTENFDDDVTYEVDIAVVDGVHIADDGTIAATALVNLPRLKTDFVDVEDEEGNVIGTVRRIVIGENRGKPVIDVDANGNFITDQVPRSVVLKQTTSSDACGVPLDDGLNMQPNKRQGAGLGFGWLLALAPLAWLRRRQR
ncbi:DUF3466 family protein [Ferrimonas pelagia]|uniref:DUF3466 family protein n=1 Tax=Ferrimonas pelagia TaxID=1177826 RepID=A0ABP9F953_9GAMM